MKKPKTPYPVRGLLAQSERLIDAWPRMTPREHELVIAMHRHYERELKDKSGDPNQSGLGAGMQSAIDGYVLNAQIASPHNARQISCAKGCAHCCRQNVTITKPEAILLARLVRECGVAVDWELVERQAAAGAGPVKWHAQPPEDWRCAFLREDKSCGVYEYRPMMCRKHFAMGGSDQCDTEKHPSGKVLNFVSMEAEIFTSAALTVLERGTLPAMLLKYRHTEEETT